MEENKNIVSADFDSEAEEYDEEERGLTVSELKLIMNFILFIVFAVMIILSVVKPELTAPYIIMPVCLFVFLFIVLTGKEEKQENER